MTKTLIISTTAWRTDSIAPRVLCFLCGTCLETHDHLYFGCATTKQIWTRILHKGNFYTPNIPWKELVNWMATHWQGNSFSDISAKMNDARIALLQIQKSLLQQQGDDVLKSQEKLALEWLILLSNAEESFLKQKSRIQWIKEGDSNSKFFHHTLKARVNRNKITSILLDSGEHLHDPQAIHAAAVHFFGTLLSDSSPNPDPNLRLESFVSKAIFHEQVVELERPVSPEEIKDTVFRMKPGKAPGPDGFSASFYQKAWHIVGGDVTQAVLSFFRSGRLLK